MRKHVLIVARTSHASYHGGVKSGFSRTAEWFAEHARWQVASAS
jgi:hypothetical protein